jgi:hypothetical protein
MSGLNQFTNNASTTLASNVLIGATSLTVSTGTGSLFPTLAGSQYFYCTLTNAAATLIEIVKVTARSSDTFTIVRGQDNTSAQAWTAGDKVELRLTAADLQNFPQLDSTNTFAAAQTFSATPVFSAGITSTATPVGVASGGTGLGTLTANNVILGNGTSTPTFVAPSTTGNLLTSNGTTWVSSAAPSGARSGSGSISLSSSTTNVTLTSSSSQLQVVSATAGGYSITLPDATTMTKGFAYFVFYNTSAFPIAVKDNSGTTREYLPVNINSTSANTGATSKLELIDNSTANGVWRLGLPIIAASFSDSTVWTGTWDTTKFNAGAYGNWGLIRVSATTALAVYTSSTNKRQVYGRAITFNATTKTLTYGSIETLIWTHPTVPNPTWASVTANVVSQGLPYYQLPNAATNGSDRGVIVFNTSASGGQYTTSTIGNYGGWVGFAIVSGEAYFSAVDQLTGNTATGGTSGPYSTFQGNPYYAGSNNAFLTYNIGYASANSGRNNVQSSMRAYTVGVSGTTVSLTAGTGNSDVNTSVDITYFLTSSPKAHTTGVMSGINFNATYNSTYGNYISYSPSTNTITSGARSPNVIWGTASPYVSPIASNDYGYTAPSAQRSWGNTAGTIVGNVNTSLVGTTYTIANGGTSTVTSTTPNTTVTYKPVESAVYNTNSTLYQVPSNGSYGGLNNGSVLFSSSNLKMLGGIGAGSGTLWACDPSTSTLNFNYASYSAPSDYNTQMFLDESNVFVYNATQYQFVPFANPFIA